MLRLLRVTTLWILLLPYAFTFVGAASNQLAMNANGDLMPVRINVVKAIDWFGTPTDFGSKTDKHPHIIIYPNGTIQLDDRHCLMTSETHLNVLSDIFDFHSGILSVGDLLLEFGGYLGAFCPFVWIALAADRLRRP